MLNSHRKLELQIFIEQLDQEFKQNIVTNWFDAFKRDIDPFTDLISMNKQELGHEVFSFIHRYSYLKLLEIGDKEEYSFYSKLNKFEKIYIVETLIVANFRNFAIAH